MRILIVSVESPWPADHGGRLRTAYLAEALSVDNDVSVVFPRHGKVAPGPVGIRTMPLHWAPPGPLSTRFRSPSHLGAHFLGPLASQLDQVCASGRYDFVYFTHSYLATAWWPSSTPVITEFANIEAERQRRSFAQHWYQAAGVSSAFEATKALKWEPTVCAKSDAVVALTKQDARTLSKFSSNVILVENGLRGIPFTHSPSDGPILFAASFGYKPNYLAAKWLLRQVWPHIVRTAPTAELHIAGRESTSVVGLLPPWPSAASKVVVHGSTSSMEPYYRNCSLAVVPVSLGAGSQLKVSEALASGRVTVCTPYSMRSAPAWAEETGSAVAAESPADFGSQVSKLFLNPDLRHEKEHQLSECLDQNSWYAVTRHLSHWMKSFSSLNRGLRHA